jgi:hypothetical protein
MKGYSNRVMRGWISGEVIRQQGDGGGGDLGKGYGDRKVTPLSFHSVCAFYVCVCVCVCVCVHVCACVRVHVMRLHTQYDSRYLMKCCRVDSTAQTTLPSCAVSSSRPLC